MFTSNIFCDSLIGPHDVTHLTISYTAATCSITTGRGRVSLPLPGGMNRDCPSEHRGIEPRCLGIRLQHLGLKVGDHFIHAPLNSAGDGHRAHADLGGYFLTRHAAEKDKFDGGAGTAFQAV